MKTPVKDSLVVFTTGARVNFDMDGVVLPIFGCNIGGEPRIERVNFGSPSDKDAFRQRILGLIAAEENSLREFVFVSECWVVHTQDTKEVLEWLARHGSLEGFPGRKEAVQVLYCSSSEEICYTAWINRGTIPPSLGAWEVKNCSGHFSLPDLATRFQGLFAQSKAGQN